MSENKKRLGRGLNSLLSSTRIDQIAETAPPQPQIEPTPRITDTIAPESRTVSRPGDYVTELPIDKINRNPHQPRQEWDQQKLLDLSESIKANGLIQAYSGPTHGGYLPAHRRGKTVAGNPDGRQR